MKLSVEHKRIELQGENAGYMSVHTTDDGAVVVKRYAIRGKVANYIFNYDYIGEDGTSSLVPLTVEKAVEVLERVERGLPYSAAYIFSDSKHFTTDMNLSEQEHLLTSTGVKFWRHQQSMFNYKNDDPNTVISGHISPEGACNLKCPYCSVTYRDTHSRIPLEVIKDYVVKLQSRGLQAVILTGGGEPLAYPFANELVKWLKFERGLDIGMITNGTLSKRLDDDAWKAFSWIRVSINIFNDWENRIGIPAEHIDPECLVGASMVYTAEHEATNNEETDRLNLLKRAGAVVERFGAKYVRILPNCSLDNEHLCMMHRAIDISLKELNDSRFFHQHKRHGTPNSHVCHQA